MIHVISLGAGVQSSTMALMAAYGEITPMPTCAIFADTQWEPEGVYKWLGALLPRLPFPFIQVTAGNIRFDTLRGFERGHLTKETAIAQRRFSAIPWFMDNGRKMGLRQCTTDYKVRPIRKKIVELMGGKRPKNGCYLWIGISTDEAHRMRDSRVQYIKNHYPLIREGMSRNDCLRWLGRHNYPIPPKSSCIGCPYHSDAQWREIKSRPDEWQQAIEVDEVIRNQPKFRQQQFMHRSCVPLAEVDLSTAEDHGQLNLFNNECEGMCGV